MYKQLFSFPLLSNQNEFYYNLESLYDFLVSDDYIKLTRHHTDRNMYNELTNCYIDNLLFLREKELPITKMNNLTHLI